MIGMPAIKHFEQKNDILKVVVEDPFTPYRFLNSSFKSIRDIFKDDLEYTLFYWKDKSTGRVSFYFKPLRFLFLSLIIFLEGVGLKVHMYCELPQFVISVKN